MQSAAKTTNSASKKVALMQPTFMPWLGYFGLIKDADEFVFLDDFQFVRRSFHQRNRLFLNKDEAGYISVPVEHPGSQDVALNSVKPQMDEKWKRKFLGTLKHNYSSSPQLQHYHDFVEDWLTLSWDNLADFNIHFIRFCMDELGIETQVSLSSSYNVSGKRSERILGLLEATKAQIYLSARGSFGYMEEDEVFTSEDIEFLFQNFQPQAYPQKQSDEFVPYLCVLDSLLQQGAEETLKTIEKSAAQFSSVQEMQDA